MQYLVISKDYSNSYLQASFVGVYSRNMGTAIMDKLPRWLSVGEDREHRVLSSDSPDFKEILKEESRRLKREIENEEFHLHIAKKNLELIQSSLKDL